MRSAPTIAKPGFDYLGLLCCLAAVGARPNPSLVVLAATSAAMLLALIPFTPGGLGFVEAGLTGLLTLAGTTAHQAVVATLAYRLIVFWLPLPLGGVASPAQPPPLSLRDGGRVGIGDLAVGREPSRPPSPASSAPTSRHKSAPAGLPATRRACAGAHREGRCRVPPQTPPPSMPRRAPPTWLPSSIPATKPTVPPATTPSPGATWCVWPQLDPGRARCG